MRARDAGRIVRTVAHLRPSQVYHRVRLTLRRALWARQGPRIDARYRERAASGRVAWSHPGLREVARARAARRPAGAALAAARDALDGCFTLLGERRELGLPVAWDRPDLMQALLWKTHLHELGWSFDLARAAVDTGEDRFRKGFFALVRAYLDDQPIAKPGFHRVAWNERVVATRLLHLATAGSLLGLREGEPDADWLGREIVRHALFLRDNLALDLLANHLFRDCVALAFAHEIAGCAPDGLALLEREVREQILPDGAHYEGSAMYHAVCLADLVDLRLLLGERAPAWLDDAVRRAGAFFEGVLLGDGDIPLLGDAWRGEVAPQPLLEQARAAAGGALAAARAPEHASGLVRLERGPVRAVIRAGPHGPDHQLGHAHADLLSFDLSYGPQRIVTDTGTGVYAAGPARMHLRSTAAHNTVQLDHEELLEAWSSFRSGRRGRARCHGRGESAGFCWLHASHDGWRWLRGAPVHHRLLAVREDAALVLDVVRGGGRHRVTSRLHLHPDVPDDAVRVQALAGALETREAPLHERFNETRPMPVYVVDLDATLPWVGGFWLRFPAGHAASAALACDGRTVRAEIEEPGRRLLVRWQLDPAEVSIELLESAP